MSSPRVLVVRSGARPFGPVAGTEVLEHVSHVIEPLVPAGEDWDGPFDTIILTSQTAVERIARDARLSDELRRRLEGARLVAVGEATAAALARHGLPPDLVAGGSARSILESLPARSSRKVLWPCGEDASTDLAHSLSEGGAEVRRLVVYRKRAAPANPQISAQILERAPAAFCATSPAAADWLFAGLSEPAAHRLRAIPAVALGPSTLERLAALGVERVEMAGQARFASAGNLLASLATARSET